MPGQYNVKGTVSMVLMDRRYAAAFIILAIIVFAAYSYLMTSSSINLAEPKIAFGLNMYAISASAAISVLLSLSLVMNAFEFKNVRASVSKLSGASIVASVVPMVACCSTVIPSMLAILGASSSTIISTTGELQGPLAVYETPLVLASIALLVVSIILSSKRVSCCIRGKNDE